jgi:hypothetical protein
MEENDKITRNNGKFVAGNKESNGRPKGSLNKQTRAIKDVINKLMECSTDDDLQDIYSELKKNNPSALLSFYGKIAPKKLDVETEFKPSELASELKKIREETVVEDSNTNIAG